MLAIGRAMMAKTEKCYLLDEPSLGIAPKVGKPNIHSLIRNINKEKKVTVFLVEQNAKKALELADRRLRISNWKDFMLEGAGKDLLKQPRRASRLSRGRKIILF